MVSRAVRTSQIRKNVIVGKKIGYRWLGILVFLAQNAFRREEGIRKSLFLLHSKPMVTDLVTDKTTTN